MVPSFSSKTFGNGYWGKLLSYFLLKLQPEVAILHAFFKSQNDKDFEKVRKLAIKVRKGLL